MPLSRATPSGLWTPALTFATPGDLAVTYATQSGEWIKVGNTVFWRFQLSTSAFTHTTSSGNFEVTGLPFVAASGVGFGNVLMAGYTKASYTSIQAQNISGTTTLRFGAGGSGQAPALLASGDVPTGGTVNILAEGQYRV